MKRHNVRRWRIAGMLFFSLFMSLGVIIPNIFFLNRYTAGTGKTPGFGVQLGISVFWLLVLYGMARVLFGIAHHRFFRKYGGQVERPPNMFDNAMEALDKISMGDFDIHVEADHHYYYNELAGKINKLARDLSSLEQMRQEFISNVSHEIQSPLTSIRGFAALLKKDDLPEETKRHYLEVIESESLRLSRMSDNLMRLSALDTGQSPFQPTSFRLDRQIEQTLLLLEPQWSEKGLEMEADMERLTVYGDEDLLSQVWINLLHNAVKFTGPGGKITVRLYKSKGQVVCTIADTGEGIAPESLVRVFERFYKADRARDRSLGGNGLGLSLVKKIVDMHAGTVMVESELGQGTVFTLCLPEEKKETADL